MRNQRAPLTRPSQHTQVLYYVERDVIVGSHNAAALGLAQDINQAVAGSNGGRMRATVDAIGAYVQLLLEDIDAVSFDRENAPSAAVGVTASARAAIAPRAKRIFVRLAANSMRKKVCAIDGLDLVLRCPAQAHKLM